MAGDAESGGNESAPTRLAFRYGEARAAPLSELAGVLRASRIFEAPTEYVSARLRGIPISIDVSFVECGEAGSWHDASAKNIIMCYEEIARIYATLQSLGDEGDGLLVSWLGAILGELYHELAQHSYTGSRFRSPETRNAPPISLPCLRCCSIRTEPISSWETPTTCWAWARPRDARA